MEVSKTPKKKEDTTMKLKKLLALALAGVMTAVTLTACAPLEVLYDWFFGGGGSASRGNEKSLVTESVELNNKLEPLKAYLGLSETTASDRAKETLEEVAKGFDAGWLGDNNMLNETAVNALKSITDDKLELTQRLCVDVMELTPSGRTAVTIPNNREIYSNSYWDPGPESGGPHYDSCLTNYGQLRNLLSYLLRNNAELYAGTFQNGGKTYAAMVIIF